VDFLKHILGDTSIDNISYKSSQTSNNFTP